MSQPYVMMNYDEIWPTLLLRVLQISDVRQERIGKFIAKNVFSVDFFFDRLGL
jgi:hypothetical protein